MDIEVGEDVRPQPKKSDKGFTLIELLIVIVILGVLSTVVVLSVGGITNKGKDSACQSDYNALATAVEAYNAQNGVYPTGQTELVPGFMRTVSTKYDLVNDGSGKIMIPTGSDCTYLPE